MFRESGRSQKSRSLLWSLYGLAFVGLAGYLVILLAVSWDLWGYVSSQHLLQILGLARESLSLAAIALLLALPFCVSITFFSVTYRDSRWAPAMEATLRLVDRAPFLLYGLFFLVLFGGQSRALLLTSVMVIVPKLSYRWIKLSKKVKDSQLDALKALGLDLWDLIKVLYIQRFFRIYMGHLFSVLCFVFTLVTPFLCFLPLASQLSAPYSVQLFLNLGREPALVSTMVTVLLCIHCFRVWFDTQIFYQEVEHG